MQWSWSSAIASDGFGLVAHDFEAADFGPAEHVAQVVGLAFDDHGTMTTALRERIVVGAGMGSHVSPLLKLFCGFAPRDFKGNQLILLGQYRWDLGLA
jgi:Zn-dependent membrane protease YugP